jgi:hypothetical protein
MEAVRRIESQKETDSFSFQSLPSMTRWLDGIGFSWAHTFGAQPPVTVIESSCRFSRTDWSASSSLTFPSLHRRWPGLKHWGPTEIPWRPHRAKACEVKALGRKSYCFDLDMCQPCLRKIGWLRKHDEPAHGSDRANQILIHIHFGQC